MRLFSIIGKTFQSGNPYEADRVSIGLEEEY